VQFLVCFQSFTETKLFASSLMLQYFCFSSLGYYSVCQFVFHELLCNITQYVMNKNINFFHPLSLVFRQTGSTGIFILGLNSLQFGAV